MRYFTFVFVFLFVSLYPEHSFYELPVGFLLSLVITIFIVTGLSWLCAKWTYHFFRYEIRPESFQKESGVIWKKYTTIPYNRVQHIDIERSLLDRIFGLSCLVVQTAGSSTPYVREGEVPGLSVQTAEQLREEITKRVESLRGIGGL